MNHLFGSYFQKGFATSRHSEDEWASEETLQSSALAEMKRRNRSDHEDHQLADTKQQHDTTFL